MPHAPSGELLGRFEDNPMTQTAHIRQDVLVLLLICRIGRTFAVNEDLLPWVKVGRSDSDLVLLHGSLSEANTGNAVINPTLDVELHRSPPDEINHELQGLSS